MSNQPGRSFGCQTVTQIIDETAQNNPSKPFAIICSVSGTKWETREITFKDVSRAVNRAAWWLEENLHQRGVNFPTIGYIGPNDIRYLVFAIAANKAGYKILYPSPRNSVAYHVHILRESDCKVMLRDHATGIDHIQNEHPNLKDIIVPSVDDLLSQDSVKDYLYHKSAESIHEPFVVLHSSGSTGPPKIIIWTQENLAKLDAQHLIEVDSKDKLLKATFKNQTPVLNTFPLFHAFSLIMSLGYACFYDTFSIIPPPGQITPATILNAIDATNVNLLAIAPSILEVLALDQIALDKLKDRSIVYGGGALSDSAGQTLSQYATVHCLMGSTESGEFPELVHETPHWDYLRFPSRLEGFQFREYNDELFELVLVRDEFTDRFHGTWITFPDIQEYSTKDLYSRHSDIPNLWKHRGRSDDTIVMSNGEKLVPTTFELKLNAAKEIRDVLLIGQGRSEVAALVELNTEYSKLSRDEALSRISSAIKALNVDLPRFARISPDRILFVTMAKPMTRAGKGSVIRKATIALYEQEINDLYTAQANLDPSQYPLLKNTDLETTAQSLANLFARVSDLDTNISPDANIFSTGFDSLNVITAIRSLRTILESEGVDSKPITSSLVYSNPTIHDLTRAIRSLNSDQDPASLYHTRAEEVEEMFTKYSADIPHSRVTNVIPAAKINVVLTGSTGSLGSYLLDTLIQSDQVETIFALNRSKDSKSRQHKANSSRNLDTDFHKVKFLHANLSEQSLGIAKTVYNEIQSTTHLIVHNQWEVDFNLSLKSMEPHVAGVRNLIDLALVGEHHPHIIFTSSVGTVGSYSKLYPESPAVPEEVFNDPRIPQPLGYGLAKQIGERILNTASQRTGLRTVVARLGQIAGPVERLGGLWNKQEWLPSIAISSAHLKALPDDLNGAVDWLPVDSLAKVLVEIALQSIQDPPESLEIKAKVYNLINSQPVQWRDVKPAFLSSLPDGTETIPLKDWVARLRQSSEEEKIDHLRNPAVKLLDFYENLADGGEVSAKMQVTNALKVSETFRKIPAVNGKWIENWMKGWGIVKDQTNHCAC